MKNKTDCCIAVALLLFCGAMAYQISLLPEPAGLDFFSAGSFPTGVTILLALLSLALLVRSFMGKGETRWPERPVLVRVLGMAALILAYVVFFVFFGEYAYDALLPAGTGFSTATFLFLAAAQFLTGYRNPLRIALIAAAVTGALYVIFGLLFQVPLP